MFKNTFILLMVAMGLLIGCGDHGGGHVQQEAPSQQDEASVHAHAEDHSSTADHSSHGATHESGTLALSLNNGEKWEMDEHTREMFGKMAGRFEALDVPNASHEELVSLGETLKGDLDDLIAGCTMVGDAHNELHQYLAMYIPAVNGLKNEGNLEKAKQVHALLGAYPEYFE